MTESQLRNWMQNRVAKELGVGAEQIGTEASLMTLGLESLSLVGIAGELAELLGKEFSADVLWEYDSISLLSRHLASSGLEPAVSDQIVSLPADTVPANPYLSAAEHWSSVHPLQPNGNRPPLFLVHGVGGGIGYYRELAEFLGNDQPVFGLRPAPEPAETLSAMAQALTDGIRSVQRKGPYCLGGFCFGGVLAYEIASRLKQAGEHVPLVFMVDTPFPWKLNSRGIRDLFASWRLQAEFFIKAPLYIAEEFLERRHEVTQRVQRKFQRWKHRLQLRLGKTEQTNAEQYAAVFFPHVKQGSNRIVAVRNYRPHEYTGRIAYFQSREFNAINPFASWNWERVASAGFERIRIPGSHQNVMRNVAAQEMARQLTKRLQESNFGH